MLSFLATLDSRREGFRPGGFPPPDSVPPVLEAIKVEVYNRGCVKGQQLADEQPADDCNSQGAAEFRSGSCAEGEGSGAEYGCHGGHHDRAKTQQARLVNRVARIFAFGPLGGKSEIYHQDGVLFHNPNQQNNSNNRYDCQVGSREHQGQQRPYASGWKRGENGNRVDITLVQDRKSTRLNSSHPSTSYAVFC